MDRSQAPRRRPATEEQVHCDYNVMYGAFSSYIMIHLNVNIKIEAYVKGLERVPDLGALCRSGEGARSSSGVLRPAGSICGQPLLSSESGLARPKHVGAVV